MKPQRPQNLRALERLIRLCKRYGVAALTYGKVEIAFHEPSNSQPISALGQTLEMPPEEPTEDE